MSAGAPAIERKGSHAKTVVIDNAKHLSTEYRVMVGTMSESTAC
jgi:hypothetical protein